MVLSSKYLNNPDICAPISVDVNETERVRNFQIVEAVEHICPWFLHSSSNTNNSSSECANEDKKHEESLFDTSPLYEIKQLGGGLSNYLYTITIHSRDNATTTASPILLIRINNTTSSKKKSDDGTDENNSKHDIELVNAETENKIMAYLSKSNSKDFQYSPMYYGRFQNGRIEEFYSNYKTLTSHEILQNSRELSKIMAKYHQVQIPFLHHPKNNDNEKVSPPDGEIWQKVDKWLDTAKSLFDKESDPLSHSLSNIVNSIDVEWKWVKDQLLISSLSDEEYPPSIKFSREIVFTHMDCQSLNIMVSSSKEEKDLESTSSSSSTLDEMKIIDFEYAGLNPRACDIANTFCECCDMNNLKADYENEYPSEEQQIEFLENYLNQYYYSGLITTDKIPDDNNNKDLFLKDLAKDVNKFALVSHLGWACWALIQYHVCPIEFDYLAYAKHRLDGYAIHKKKFFL